MSKFKMGWAEVSITPEKRISLAGQFAERISEYVEKPLTATALAVDTGDDQMVMCSVDLVCVSCNLVWAVRAELQKNTVGLDPQKVIIAAIHTHTGPEYMRYAREYVSLPNYNALDEMMPAGKKYVPAVSTEASDIATQEEVFALLVKQISQVVLDAWNARREGSFSNAFGRAAVGMCRRVSFSDGTAQMWGDTDTAVFTHLEGGNDSGIELLYVFDENKQLSGIVANLACPAQCVQHRLFVSPDFWGEVKMLLRQRFGEGLFLLPLCGAAGDQCPVDLIRWVEPDSDLHDPNLSRSNPPKRKADPSMFDLQGMRKTGKRIAREIIDVYDEGLDDPQEDPLFVHHVHNMQLPLRRTTLTEYRNARKAVEEYLRNKEGDINYNDRANMQVDLGIMRRFKLQEVMETLDTEVHIIRMGTIAFATNPFELFLDYGNQIKARSRAEQTFLVQLANGAEGYLPTEKAEKGGHYSAFIASGEVGHEGGDQLVRETLKDINKLFRA